MTEDGVTASGYGAENACTLRKILKYDRRECRSIQHVPS